MTTPTASTSSLDVPLGDLIAQHRPRGGGGRRGGKGGRRGGGDGEERKESHPLDRSGGDRESGGPQRHNRRGDRSENRRNDPYGRQDRRPRGEEQWQRQTEEPRLTQRVVGDTVRVSNLDPRNGENELRFIFEKIGPITRIQVYFDQTGRSTGTAEVQFGSNIAAETAVKQLDQAEVDGRLMYVQLVGQLMQVSAPVVQRRRDGTRDDGRDRREQSRGPREDRRDGGNRREGGGGGRGGGKGGREGGKGGRKDGGGRQEKKPASAEDLDADMDSYHSSKPQQQAAAPATEAAAPAAME